MFGLNLACFFLFQVAASLFFKWGSTAPSLFWPGFLLGNLFGMTSIFFLISIYKVMNANMALAICTGGAFLLNQIAMFIFYGEKLSFAQWSGIFLIFAGILLISFCGGKSGDRPDSGSASCKPLISTIEKKIVRGNGSYMDRREHLKIGWNK